MNIEQFAHPYMLWFLAVIPLMAVYYIYRLLGRGTATVTISSVGNIARLSKGAKYYLRHLPAVLRMVAVGLLIVALARPQSTESGTNSNTLGIDIVLSLDISSSMLARDLTPDRITAAKTVARDFIYDRPSDRIGLVVFAGESFTQCPLTTDKATLTTLLSQIRSGIIDDGTAIGNGLATALNRLKDSNSKSKVVILLTDGVNNSGQISPQTAAEIAETLGIRVYTIGVGSEGMAPVPVIDAWGQTRFANMPVEIDEKVLTEIAEKTGGKYFRATDNETLKSIYDEINQLEKNRIESDNFTRYHETYLNWVLLALACLVLGFLLQSTYLRRIP
jgi:Ca-activated chloride channel family protein